MQTNGVFTMKKDPLDRATLQFWEPGQIIVHKVLDVWRSEHCLREAQGSWLQLSCPFPAKAS